MKSSRVACELFHLHKIHPLASQFEGPLWLAGSFSRDLLSQDIATGILQCSNSCAGKYGVPVSRSRLGSDAQVLLPSIRAVCCSHITTGNLLSAFDCVSNPHCGRDCHHCSYRYCRSYRYLCESQVPLMALEAFRSLINYLIDSFMTPWECKWTSAYAVHLVG